MKYSFETEVVYCETITKQIDVLGVFFKDEKVLNYGNDKLGIIKNVYSDGERVSKNSEIAKKYASESDIKNLNDLKKIDYKISNFKKLNNSNLKTQSFGNLNKKIHDYYFELLHCLKNSNGKFVGDVKNKMVNVFNQKQILTGKVKNFNSSIENLQNERASKLKLISSSYKSIYSPCTGYFVGSADGFEQKCCLNKVDEFDAKNLKKLYDSINIKNKINNCVGKIIFNPKILFKALFPKSFYIDFKVGSWCTLQFDQTGEEIPAELVDFNFGLNGETVATFEIDSVTNQLASLRKSRAKVGFKKYYGLKVNKLAIKKNENNQVGVYVLVGSSLKFKLIDILIEDKDFIISKNHDIDNDYLKELDEVVIKGKDLYERKKIKKN